MPNSTPQPPVTPTPQSGIPAPTPVQPQVQTPTPTPQSGIPAPTPIQPQVQTPTPNPAPTTPTPVQSTVQPTDLAASQEKQAVKVDEGAKRHYQTYRVEKDTNLTLPKGVKFYGMLSAVKVTLPKGTKTTKVYVNGAYREVENGDIIVCSKGEAFTLSRSNLFTEIPDAKITLNVG